MSNARATASQTSHPSLLTRLKDPQVWVCAIAAFTLIGLSTGMLEPAETSPAQVQMVASSSR